VVAVPVDDPAVIDQINTPDDYERLVGSGTETLLVSVTIPTKPLGSRLSSSCDCQAYAAKDFRA